MTLFRNTMKIYTILLSNNDQLVIGILFEIHTGMVTVHKRDFLHWDTEWIALNDPSDPSNQIKSQGEGSFVFWFFPFLLFPDPRDFVSNWKVLIYRVRREVD